MIVVSNQAGVAWGYFKPSRVKEINQIIDNLLQAEGLYVAAWIYCPVVDSEYAKGQGIEKFVPEFVAEDTDRKPSVNMVFKALKKLQKSISEYERVLVLGDRGEDEEMARNLKAEFRLVRSEE
jgi:histidinol phosphatase-like enzyme